MDQDRKPEFEIREDIAEFDEEHPLSMGEFFGNFEQNFPGGNYRNLPSATLDHKRFLAAVDNVLLATERERRDFISRELEVSAETPLIEILKDLRQQYEKKRREEDQMVDEKRIEELGEEIVNLRNKINGLLFPPYLELRLKGFDHTTITL